LLVRFAVDPEKIAGRDEILCDAVPLLPLPDVDGSPGNVKAKAARSNLGRFTNAALTSSVGPIERTA